MWGRIIHCWSPSTLSIKVDAALAVEVSLQFVQNTHQITNWVAIACEFDGQAALLEYTTMLEDVRRACLTYRATFQSCVHSAEYLPRHARRAENGVPSIMTNKHEMATRDMVRGKRNYSTMDHVYSSHLYLPFSMALAFAITYSKDLLTRLCFEIPRSRSHHTEIHYI